MLSTLAPQEFLAATAHLPVLDVRTPAEYTRAHLPASTNLPLFYNEERVQVGTLYKQQGRSAAVLLGLQLVGPRLAEVVHTAGAIAGTARTLGVYCWRGGMRSASVGWLLAQAGLRVLVLQGGYKAYRNYLLQVLERKYRFIVLAGPTGVGKTELLQRLAGTGQQVVDLEALAHHKGSAFGALGQLPQPSPEQFENSLAEALLQLDASKPIWVEDESRLVGQCVLPATFWQQLQAAPLVLLQATLHYRTQRLVQEYGCYPAEVLAGAIQKISRRLGGLNTTLALQALAAGDLYAVATLLLAYYDKAYAHTLLNRSAPIASLQIESHSWKPIIDQLVAINSR